MSGRAAKVIITERQQEILQTLARPSTCAQALAQRARITLLAFDGLDNEQIAQRLGCERHCPGVWRRRWAAAFDRLVLIECCEGPIPLRRAIEDLLADLPRPGCPGKFSPEQVAQILAVACEDPQQCGRPVSHWSPAELADEVVHRGIVTSISPRHVGRFLKRPSYSRTANATGSTPSLTTPRLSSGRSKRCVPATW